MKWKQKGLVWLAVIALLVPMCLSHFSLNVRAVDPGMDGKVRRAVEVDDTVSAGTGVGVEVTFYDSNDAALNYGEGENAYTGLNVSDTTRNTESIVTIPAGATKFVVKLTDAGKQINMDNSGVFVDLADGNEPQQMGINSDQITSQTGQIYTLPQGFDVATGFVDVHIALTDPNANQNQNGNQNDPNQGQQDQGQQGQQNQQNQPDPQMRYALLINVNGTQYRVDPDTNIINLPDADISDMQFMIDEFIDLNDNTHIILQNVGSNSGATDSEGRNPLEIQTPVENAHTANRWVMNINYHSGDDPILANRNCPEFYFTNLTFVSTSYKGVQVSFSKKPDMYQDTVYTDKVDIAGTTDDNPARTGVYYDSDDFTLTDVGGVPVQSIQVTDKINPNAVTITGNTVRFNSGFYASIPLVVTLADGTTGYLTVERLGLEIDMVPTTGPAARSATNHGSQPGIALSASSEASTYNIVGIYYYDAANSYTDFDLVAKLVFPDGHVETKVVSGYAEKANNDPSLKAGDYMVWSGTSMDNMPVTVSVTAVRHGATGGSSFGGALFGAGAGLTKSNLH